MVQLNSSTQNINKATGEDSFSRSDKEDGGKSPGREGSPPKEGGNQEAGGDDGDKKEGSRSRSKEGGADAAEKGS